MANGAVVGSGRGDVRARLGGKPAMWRLPGRDCRSKAACQCDSTKIGDALSRPRTLKSWSAGARLRRRLAAWNGTIPAYTTRSVGLGYPTKGRALTRAAVADGWTRKMKVGGDIEDDVRGTAFIRAEIGPDR